LLFCFCQSATWSRELFGQFPKQLPHFEEIFFEIVEIFGGFGQILVVPQHVLGFLDFLISLFVL
jgi:hypothetical protein